MWYICAIQYFSAQRIQRCTISKKVLYLTFMCIILGNRTLVALNINSSGGNGMNGTWFYLNYLSATLGINKLNGWKYPNSFTMLLPLQFSILLPRGVMIPFILKGLCLVLFVQFLTRYCPPQNEISLIIYSPLRRFKLLWFSSFSIFLKEDNLKNHYVHVMKVNAA